MFGTMIMQAGHAVTTPQWARVRHDLCVSPQLRSWTSPSPRPTVTSPPYAPHCPPSVSNCTQEICVQCPSRSFAVAMRLLDTNTGQFVEKDPEKTRYAVLSHTWDDKGEQTYEELKRIQRRYAPVSQTPLHSLPVRSEAVTSSSREWNRDGVLRTAIPSSTTGPHPPTALGGLTQSEVEALRAFIEVYGLASPTPASAFIWDDPELSPKIGEACTVARKDGYDYIWIDSCCIDKSSSSELSEAINSMYKWYGHAVVCYAYLADVPPGEDRQAEGSAFRKTDVEFLSKDWAPIGSKHDLVELVEAITKIDYKALLHLEPLDSFSVAQRLSWAAKRNTTREEDRAYSLLGIFDIHMSALYGEGDRAFRRLQEQIMQRFPDQSLFAWGDFYIASQVITIRDTWNAAHEIQWESGDDPRQLFARSPHSFQNCAAIRTPQHRYHNTIECTSTPYGIRTQLHMIPLTPELLICATKLDKDIQLGFLITQWYLAILEYEHSEYPWHLLGRVCYIPPSESGVEYVHSGGLHGVILLRGNRKFFPDLFPLSPETIERFRPHTELKTVYIPHPDRTTLPQSHSLQFRPYATIKLVLLKKARDALRSRGYSTNLRAPDPAHPTTHSLTLTKDEHTITIEFRHTLGDGGEEFTIDAEVKMSPGSRAQVDSSAPGSDQAESRHTVSWEDNILVGWFTKLDHKSVRLSAAGAGTLSVDLGLDFAGRGSYVLHVDVLSDAPAPASSLAVELVVD
ncbi:hypothetical protein V8D89_000313 [Ganoderma adspersum]